MKLTKKMLAVVMALGMIVCMAAFAFAANGTYSLDVTRPNDNTVVATLNARNMIGLSSGKAVVTYEGLVLDHVSNGIQAKAVNDAAGNAYDATVNAKETGKIQYGFTFLESLWTADQFAAASPDDQVLKIDTEMFDLASFTFKIDEKAEKYKIAIVVESKNGDEDNEKFEYVWEDEKKQPETTTCNPCDPGCEPTTRCCCPAGTCPETTTCSCGTCNCQHTPKTDGGQDTGDNGILAVMAGVMALAGAAVVVTRKRK